MDAKHLQPPPRLVDTPRTASSEQVPPGKRLFIKTYGCQMNVHDSDRMADAMAPEGYRLVDRAEDADLILLNTCHIREKATEKVYSELGRLRQISEARKAEGSKLIIGVAGCVAQAEGEEIRRRQPLVDLVVGPQAYHRLPEMTRAALAGERPIDTEFPPEDKFDHLPAPQQGRAPLPSAFLTIQEGCDKFCAFCVVPYTRGAEVSRPAERILAEAKALVARGVREITLLGQNVNAWHGTGRLKGLGALLRALADIPGLERLRYTTSHPNDMDEDLIAAHRDLPQLMPYLHLPVQSGSDRILKAMNRKHDAEGYRRLIDRIRAARSDLALSSDFIVGFPGETDADFAATLALIRDVGFAQAYSFKYSPRPGTPAASSTDQLPEAVKDARLQELQALINAQATAFNQSKVGTTMEVLFEKPGKHPGQATGRSPWLQAVHVRGDLSQLMGQIRPVRIIKASGVSLSGELCTE